MSGNIPGHGDTRMQRHDALVQSIPHDVRGVLDKTRDVEANFHSINQLTEAVSGLSFQNAAAGVRGAHAGSLGGNHLVEHIDAVHKHSINLAQSTRGERHQMSPDEVKSQHEKIGKIRVLVDNNRRLMAGIHEHLVDLHTKLALLEEIYSTE